MESLMRKLVNLHTTVPDILPYSFDLIWGIKTRDKLVEALKHEDKETFVEINETMDKHGIALTELESSEIESWRRYVKLTS
jgi:hypothetical protein